MAAPGHIKHGAVGGPMSADFVHETASLQSLEHDFCGLQVGSVGSVTSVGFCDFCGLIVISGGFRCGLPFAALHRCHWVLYTSIFGTPRCFSHRILFFIGVRSLICGSGEEHLL